MIFHDSLISTYSDNPCQVLPNAIWKTLAQLENLQTSIRVQNDNVVELKAWNEKIFLVYWTRSREDLQDLLPEQNRCDTALIHQDYLYKFPAQKYAIQKPYFRLIHTKEKADCTGTPLPLGFNIVEVNIQNEFEMVANFIDKCYQDISPTIETIKNWTNHPTFDESLWVWVFDNKKETPVGLGIAEIDTDNLEGSLEWIQVLPGYRRMGLGKSIVQELLSRLEKRVNFTTVSGEVNNDTNPEALYRSCGFKGSDIWWMCRKE